MGESVHQNGHQAAERPGTCNYFQLQFARVLAGRGGNGGRLKLYKASSRRLGKSIPELERLREATSVGEAGKRNRVSQCLAYAARRPVVGVALLRPISARR
jgi:hypothetical protein